MSDAARQPVRIAERGGDRRAHHAEPVLDGEAAEGLGGARAALGGRVGRRRARGHASPLPGAGRRRGRARAPAGEAFGLAAGDIDWLHRIVHVRRQVRVIGIRLSFAPPKGGKERDIPLPGSSRCG